MTIITKVLNAVAEYRSYRATYKELSVLSDHMLADLGIVRAEIKAVAAGKSFARHRGDQQFGTAKAGQIADILPLNANTFLATDIAQLKSLPKAA